MTEKIIGHGTWYDKTAANIIEREKKLEIKNRVIFTGARRDIEKFLPFVDLFVLPSISEGTSHTLLEALASEVPVVATNVGDAPYLLDKEFLVEPKNVKDLKLKIERVLKEKKIQKLKDQYLLENVLKRIRGVLE